VRDVCAFIGPIFAPEGDRNRTSDGCGEPEADNPTPHSASECQWTLSTPAFAIEENKDREDLEPTNDHQACEQPLAQHWYLEVVAGWSD